MYKIVVRPRADRNIQKIYQYYTDISPRAGKRFLTYVALRYASLLRNPEAYSIKQSRRYREALVRNYPYVIYFKVEGDVVVIYRVVGTAQNR